MGEPSALKGLPIVSVYDNAAKLVLTFYPLHNLCSLAADERRHSFWDDLDCVC